jgi:hypothetical protein
MGTNEPTLMRDFVAAHGRVIYKPTQRTRSIVQDVDDDALARSSSCARLPGS